MERTTKPNLGPQNKHRYALDDHKQTHKQETKTTAQQTANAFNNQFVNSVKHTTNKNNRKTNRCTKNLPSNPYIIIPEQTKKAIKNSKNNNCWT